MTDPALTTTSFAILGHLAMQDWTMYDLAQQMRRNVHFFFPRAESQVYAEPKKLVVLGLATSRREPGTRGDRTVYAITESGRTALQDWLKTPPARGFQLEFEAILRVYLANFGTPDDLRQAIEHAKAEAAQMRKLAFSIRDEYLEGRAPFQRYVLTRAFVHDFLSTYAVFVDDWAARSLERLGHWPEETPEERLQGARRIVKTAGLPPEGIA